MKKHRGAIIDSVFVFLIACWLIGPLFKLEYLDNWGSIESTFIADARMLREHLPHPAWQPLWYCGTRFDYIYPPALRYGTALLSFAARISTARAYHLYTAFFYAVGIAGVYWLAYIGARSRVQAWIAALATATFSPCLLLLSNLRHDSPFWVPQRLHVLARYGEGPHISALSILGWALAASFIAVREWKPFVLALAGALCAAAVATNFYGAAALALFLPVLTWAVWLETRRASVWLRAAAIAAVAYGLSAFWLTPSYVRITALNLRWVAEPSKPTSVAIMIVFVFLFGIASFVIAPRRRITAWPMFLAGSAIFTALYVLGWNYFGLSITGDATRLCPELDLALILLLAWGLVTAWKRRPLRPLVIVVLCAAAYPAARYILNRKTPFARASAASVAARPEFQVTKWMAENLPAARALPAGSIRYWYNAWYDDEEAYGGSNQGMLNQILPDANWQITQGDRADLAVAWLQALGIDCVIVSDHTSAEMFHDYLHPEKFRVLTEIYNDRAGNIIYRVPRRFPSIARVVDPLSLRAAGTPRAGDDRERLMRYVTTIESGPDSEAVVRKRGWDALDIETTVSPGEAVLLQETFDPAWRAEAGGQTLSIEPDPLGFMLIAAPPSAQTIHLRFETPLENHVGWSVSILTFTACIALIVAAHGWKPLSWKE